MAEPSKARVVSPRKKFLMNAEMDEMRNDENDHELPTRKRFITLTQQDYMANLGGRLSDFPPLTIKEEPTNIEITNNRCSIRKSQINPNIKLIDPTLQKIFEEQKKMREEMQKQYEKFNEYTEIKKIENEMKLQNEEKLKKEKELKEKKEIKNKQKEENLNKLEKDKEIELNKIKEIINKEFIKRDNELKLKENEIIKLKEELNNKINKQNNLNNELLTKSAENKEIINNLNNKINDLQQTQPKTDEISNEIESIQNEIKDIEIEQNELLNQQNESIQKDEILKSEENELKLKEDILSNEKDEIEVDKKDELTKRSKIACNKFDILRANIIMEYQIKSDIKMERNSLLNMDDMINEIKLSMKKKFKEQMMRLKLQINDKKNNKLPYITLSNSYFGEDNVIYSCSNNSEYVACVGINNILHVFNMNGESIYMHSLKQIIDVRNNQNDNINALSLQWNEDDTLLGILLSNSKWIGMWNSITKEFYEFGIDDSNTNNEYITSFAISSKGILVGMKNGDIHIKQIDGIEYSNNVIDDKMISIKKKMLDGISICKYSFDKKFGIIASSSHIAIMNDIGLTAERIVSRNNVTDLKCGMAKNNNILTIISSNNLIFHGINCKSQRNRITFDTALGEIVCHCWCNQSIIVAFTNGSIVAVNALSFQQQSSLSLKAPIKTMDAVCLAGIGCIISVIDDKSIRFIKLFEDTKSKFEWKLIATIDYTKDKWPVPSQIPTTIQLTTNGKYSLVGTDKGTMLIYKLMI